MFVYCNNASMYLSSLILILFRTLHFPMIFLHAMETVRLSLAVNLFPLLFILLLGLGKSNFRLLLSGYLNKVSVISNVCDIVVHQFHESWEVLRVTNHVHYAVVFEFFLSWCASSCLLWSGTFMLGIFVCPWWSPQLYVTWLRYYWWYNCFLVL